MAAAVAVTLPGVVFRLGGVEPVHWLAAAVYGLAIVGAAFMLAWAAEALQLDVSPGPRPHRARADRGAARVRGRLHVRVEGGRGPRRSTRPLALANMTGGNRLLIGVGLVDGGARSPPGA